MTHGSQQRDLPIASVEEADAAYLDAVRDCRLPASAARLLEWIIAQGRRDMGTMVVRRTSQRRMAEAVGLSLSSYNRALGRLRESRLLVQTDGELRLVLPHLVAVAELARARAAPDYGEFDAAEALRRVAGVPSCPTVFHSVPPCSVRIRRSVERQEKTPVPRSVEAPTDPERAQPERVEQSGTRRDTVGHGGTRSGLDGLLSRERAWQVLQTRHFRPRLDLAALRAAFGAAVEAGLLSDCHEHELRFLATARDLGEDLPRPGHGGIRSPAIVLRSRVERNTCYRSSDAALEWAKGQLAPRRGTGVAESLAPSVPLRGSTHEAR